MAVYPQVRCQAEHIGDVYQLLLSLVGVVVFESVIDPGQGGSSFVGDRLEESVHFGHSFCLASQWKWER